MNVYCFAVLYLICNVTLSTGKIVPNILYLLYFPMVSPTFVTKLQIFSTKMVREGKGKAVTAGKKPVA